MLELRKGTQLADRYTLVRRLGGDSETHTWLAEDRLTRASVALKISAADQDQTGRLRAEWQASIRMMHAHVVRAFEFHATADAAFFSQQFIDGPDLSVLTGLPPADILGPITYLVDALAYVHAKGIVHRDLKASNVLLDSNGAPYLSDFGASCAVGHAASGGSMIAASPQSLAGHPAATSDDIFALGTLIYELLAGRPPWSPDDMATHIRQKEPAPLRAADGSEFSEAATALVSSMLDKRAEKRPSAEDISAALQAARIAPSTANVDSAARTLPAESHDELIESIHSIRPASRDGGDIAAPLEQQTSGLSPKHVGIALAVLIAILLGSVFILPDKVANTSKDSVAERPVVEDPRAVDQDDAASIAADGESRSRDGVYVDPAVRQRIQGATEAPTLKLEGDDDIKFSENRADYTGLDDEGRARFNAESTLGELLSALEVLESRGVERWGTTEYLAARDLYARGDQAYLEKDFAYAEELYLGAITVLEPLYERIEPTFQKAYAGAIEAFEAGDRLEALRLFELAVAVTPSHRDAQAGYKRASNLESVLRLVEQGIEYEEDLELEAAQSSFEQAAALDSLWQPAHDGILRVQELRTEIEFDTRMTEGFEAIAADDYFGARAAFRVAQQLIPGSREPADGLLQVDQGLRLQDITTLEREAQSLEQDEHWTAVVTTYEEILKVDNTLSFATEGLAHAQRMSSLHAELDKLIVDPDRLSVPSVMQNATMLVVDITIRQDVGPRLAGQRDELSRLLKRAATPLTVPLVSDNVTEVFIYKVGRLGNFMRKEVNLRPGTYVVVGSRPGFRDVRLEFRVAPEIEMVPVIVQCEEQI